MGRKRNSENLGLPKYVEIHGKWFTYRPYLRERGKHGKRVKLCPASAKRSEVWEAYEKYAEDLPTHNLRKLLETYNRSDKAQTLSPATMRNYRQFCETISSKKTGSGKLFGDVDVESITPGVMRLYMDSLTDTPILANRHLQYLKAAFNWAFERDMVMSNPCKGVRQFKQQARTRYVTDDEYMKMYAVVPPYIQVMMELAYLCRARRGEILALKWSDVKPEGLLLTRTKGSKTQIIEITERLQAALNAAKALPGLSSVHLIHNQQGQRIKEEAFTSQWQRSMKKADCDQFNFHDLKAKAVSDVDGDKLKASGHKSAAMLNVYDRKTETVKATK